MGTEWARHAMCESALRSTDLNVVVTVPGEAVFEPQQ
jgi:hypothetical protein